jgi:glycosyltransferase involved in cell wall biosynthesis
MGIECEVAPLLDDDYLARRFASERISPRYLMDRYWRRLRQIHRIRRFDVAVLQYEAFPYVPAWLENFLVMKIPFVVDIDDAIFHSYDCHPNAIVRATLGKKIPSILRKASYVLAGSPYLLDYARKVNVNVDWSPTCVDISRFAIKRWDDNSDEPFVIGWIGSPSTVQFVAEAVPAICELSERMPVRLICVGSGQVSYTHITPEIREWSEATEVDEMLRFDVGIMPLPDEPWTRGKCSFKLIQYMACGLPVVASPVGMNNTVVTHGENGFLASSTEQWLSALEALASDISLRKKMGAAGRSLVQRMFTTEIGGAKLLQAIRSAAKLPLRSVVGKA